MTAIRPRLMPAVLTLVVFSICAPVFAQTETGRILGSVFDQTQAVVVGAAVSITDTQRGQTRNLTTNDAGEYLVPNLLAGVYTVRASAQGFKNVERRNVELQVASDVRIDFVLQPGDTQQTVTITEEAPLVDATSAVLGGTLTNATINEMPLNGRNFMGLLQLRPGVMIYPVGGKWSQSTNSLHGTAYSFGRDSALDADNPFIPAGQPKQLTQLEQFGATVGGPIKKDKLFFF